MSLLIITNILLCICLIWLIVKKITVDVNIKVNHWNEPKDDDLNFLDSDHYIEVSGILEESKTNTLKGRIKRKHDQISRGTKHDETSSVIVTLFSEPKTVKEYHK